MNKEQIKKALKEENAVDIIREAFVTCENELKEVKAASEEIEALKEAKAKSDEELEALKEQLAAAKADPSLLKKCPKTFTVDGIKYGFKKGIMKVHVSKRMHHLKSGVYDASEIASDKELREILVEEGFGGFEVLNDK